MDMHIDSGPTAAASRNTAGPAIAPLHLDLPANDLMDVESDFAATPSMPSVSAAAAAFAQSPLLSPSMPASDTKGVQGLLPVPSPPVVVVTGSDISSFP